ncbi:hypothetical protein BT96DRAFT_412596 [Gymnopus androsaceus JB14]|uniref:Uncharacterized protein n=1 Tax=Gymnopus androsaceus JB14 TaxID=1447944 RepID=A0A6A4I7F2_9AGAR|nr:hypothetical protein BT96DRAFT_412596 [Gymnopus androsaceus JB14]
MSPNSEMDVDGLVQPPKPSPPALAPVASPQNGKLISPITETAAATALPPSPTSTSASALASLLSSTLAQVESLKERLKKEKRRADHFEGLATDYKDLLNEGTEAESAKKPADGEDKADVAMESSAASQLATAAEKIRQLRESVAAAEEVRDEEMARRLAITDLWAQLNQYIDRLESAGRDVRAGFDRVVKHGGGVLRDYGSMFKDIPQLSEGDLMRVDRNYNANGVLQPLGPSRRHEYSHGTRRPRSGSMDAYAYSSGPNSKRVRYQNEHPHPQAYYQHPPPPPGNPLSPPTHIQHAIIQNVPFSQGQPQPPSLAGSSSGSGSGSRHRHGDPSAMPPPPDHMYAVPGPPGYEHSYRSQDQPREYREDRRRRRRDRSRSFPRSPSRGSEGSLDLDEMLLAATSADEQHLQANGNAVPGQPVLVSGRRKDRSHGSVIYDPRDGAQFVHQVPPHSVSPHAQHITAHHSSHHLVGGPPPPPHVAQYPQTSSERHSPSFSSGSRPSSSRRHREALRAEPTLRDDLGHAATGPGQVQYQTHVFAPVQTGAPVKKTKFNNTGSGANIAEEPHSNSPAPNPPVAISTSTNSLPLASVNLAPATSPFPPTNEQGQRICRQCGMPGRYKEGKCVEKWGPGPMGPGTVCDR